jgi:hypothetical protein
VTPNATVTNGAIVAVPKAAASVEAPAVVRLPLALVPEQNRGEFDRGNVGVRPVRRNSQEFTALQRSLAPVGTAPKRLVETCRNSLVTGARPYGALRVEAVGAGESSRARGGATVVPLQARIVYANGRNVEVRQARITCNLNTRGQVMGFA